MNCDAEMLGVEPLVAGVLVDELVDELDDEDDDELPHPATIAPTVTASAAPRIQWNFTVAPSFSS